MSQTLIPPDSQVTDSSNPLPEVPPVNPPDAEVVSVKRFPRLKKWLIRGCLLMGVFVVVLGVVAKVSFDRVEAKAALVNRTGVSLNKFFNQYSSTLLAKDVDTALLSFSDPDRIKSPLLSMKLASSRDGVDSYQWSANTDDSPVGLRTQIESLLAPFGEVNSAKTKIMSMRDIDHSSARVKVLVWMRGKAESRLVESKVQFQLGVEKRGDQWAIQSMDLLSGRTVIGKGTGFQDITQQSGITFRATHNPMLELPEWYPHTFQIMRYASAGVSVADYDGDGNRDIFFADGSNPTLFRGHGDGTFSDAMDQAKLPRTMQAVHVAIFADLDNDGDQDLFLGRSTGNNFLYRNEGDGTFTDVTQDSNVGGVWVSTAAALDYDNDGRVDLFLGRYLDPRTSLPDTNFYTRNGEGASLLRNTGKLVFEDVTEKAGIDETGLNLGISCADWDQDGDQDIYVANDFGRNAMLQNNGDGTFTDVSQKTGTEDIGYGMSSCFADVNNSGRLSLYVASVHSGQRWFGNSATLQRYLFTSVRERTIFEDYPLYREIYKYLDGDWAEFGEKVIRGNSLLINKGDGTFENVTEQCQTNPHGWYWSSTVFDFDNDTQQDIYTVNGWITGKLKDDL